MLYIGVVGKKKTGKTTTIEAMTRELVKRGYGVAVAKHVPEPDFTIDTEGKDTWRFAKSGANKVIVASEHEIAVIEKTHGNVSLAKVLRRCRGSDVVFLEGFKRQVASRKAIYKIVVATSIKDVEEATKIYQPILSFAGPCPDICVSAGIPYFDVANHVEGIVDIIAKLIKRKV
jgi:molybdopterin-guanine dinucleotide biosynthesis protein B